MTSMFMALDAQQTEGRVPAMISWGRAIGLILLAVAIFAHIMTFPIGHDEQIHVVAGRFFLRQPLYGVLGYNHLPGLPMLLSAIYGLTGNHYLLLAGRLLIFACWIAIAAMFRVIARANGGDGGLAIVAMLVFMAGTPLGPTGMLVTNNLLPIPFALLGLHLFMEGMKAPDIKRLPIFASGVAVGFAIMLKISYLFLVPPFLVTALLARDDLPIRQRLGFVILPLLAGGALGSAPALVVVAGGPSMLYAHTVRYFTAGHLAYWQHSTDPKAMTLAAKVVIASDVWLAGSGMLAAMLAGMCAWTLMRSGRLVAAWPIGLVAMLVLFGMAGSFAPTPAFPQYYEPPIPFLIVLAVLLHGRLHAQDRASLRPLFGVAAILALAIIVPRLVTTLPSAARPSRWTGVMVHAQGQKLARLLAERHVEGRVASLAPIMVLEGGLPIYPEFGAGPFVYRVADYLPEADRRLFTTTSPQQLARFLAANPPAAIVTGHEPGLDPAFERFAQSQQFESLATGDDETRLFVRRTAAADLPATIGAR